MAFDRKAGTILAATRRAGRALRSAIAGSVAAFALSATAAAPDPLAGHGLLLGAGPDFGAPSARVWRRSVAGVEVRGDRDLWRGVRPTFGLGVTRAGSVLATAGAYRVFRIGPVAATPHFGPALFHDGRAGLDARALVQFRSGIDLFVPVGETVALGLGVYHVSNAGITSHSANLDVVQLSVLLRR